MRRIYSLAKNILKSNFNLQKYPYRLTFILTYKCNLKCQMCNIWQKNGESELNLSEIESFFKKFSDFNWINISGGEIFLREDILEIIDVFTSKCKNLYLLDFPTNGFLTERIVNSVKKILNLQNIPPRIFITVSLDGPELMHDEIRGVKGSWSRAIETFNRLRQIKDRRLKVFFGMTISYKNVAEIENTIKAVKQYLPKINHCDFHVNILHHSEHYYQNDKSKIADNSDLIRYWIAFIKKRGLTLNPVAYLERSYQCLAEKYIKNNKVPLPCKALRSSCFIDPSGYVFPCSIMNVNLGNLKEFDFDIEKLWASKKSDDVRKLISSGSCPQCWTPCEAYQTILGNLFKNG